MENKKSNKTQRITIRMTPLEFDSVVKKMRATTCRRLSEYCRKKILERPITMNHRNQSLDEFMQELMLLRKVLNGMANNFNQVVKRLHTIRDNSELRNWLTNYELHRQILMNKTEEMKAKINSIADKWLQ